MRILLIIALLAVLLLLLWQSKTNETRRWFKSGLIGIGIVVLIWLAASGRLHWLVAAIGAAIPLLNRLLVLLRALPVVRQIRTMFAQKRNSHETHNPTDGRFLRLFRDSSGKITGGEVLTGPHQGERLQHLSTSQLAALLTYYLHRDPHSANLLKAYLEQCDAYKFHDDKARHQQERSAAPNTLSRTEALQILGLNEPIDREKIIQAHRQLMQKLHPDRGGSAWLATKLNQAKARLIQDLSNE